MKVLSPEGKNARLLTLALILAATLVPRLILFSFESGDYTGNLKIWYQELQSSGFAGLKNDYTNYPPSYLYLLYPFSLLPISPLWGVKLASLPFDYLLAWAVFRLVRLKHSERRAVQAACLALLLPTVLFNTSLWGQSDSIYTAFLLLSLHAFMKEDPNKAYFWMGMSFMFKIQTVFIALLPLALLARGRFHLKYLLWVPGIFVLSLLPAWIAGRPLGNLLTLYVSQAGTHDALSLFAPNVYQWLSWAPTPLFTTAGIVFTASLVLLFFVWIWNSRVSVNRELLLQITLFSFLLIPFFLPRMHDRYFFPADVLSLVYACYYPRRWYLPVLIGGASFFAYLRFLFATLTVFPFSVLALVMFLALLIVGRDLYRSVEQHEKNNADS